MLCRCNECAGGNKPDHVGIFEQMANPKECFDRTKCAASSLCATVFCIRSIRRGFTITTVNDIAQHRKIRNLNNEPSPFNRIASGGLIELFN